MAKPQEACGTYYSGSTRLLGTDGCPRVKGGRRRGVPVVEPPCRAAEGAWGCMVLRLGGTARPMRRCDDECGDASPSYPRRVLTPRASCVWSDAQHYGNPRCQTEGAAPHRPRARRRPWRRKAPSPRWSSTPASAACATHCTPRLGSSEAIACWRRSTSTRWRTSCTNTTSAIAPSRATSVRPHCRLHYSLDCRLPSATPRTARSMDHEGASCGDASVPSTVC